VLSSGQWPAPIADGPRRFDCDGDAIQQMRNRNILAGLPFDGPLRMLDLIEHYHATADAQEECSRLLWTLKIQRYWGDYGL
jgi:hypothetical protein